MEFVLGLLVFCVFSTFGWMGFYAAIYKEIPTWGEFAGVYVLTVLIFGAYSIYKAGQKPDLSLDKIVELTDRCNDMDGQFALMMETGKLNRFVCSKKSDVIFEAELHNVTEK